MPINIASDVLSLAGSIATQLRHTIGTTGALRTRALAGSITVLDALQTHEALTAAIRWIDQQSGTTGLAAAFGVRFGVTPGNLVSDWTATRNAARALATGIYTVLPKAADGTVQIYGPPDATTGERMPLLITLTGPQQTSFTNLYNAFAATVTLV